MNVASCMLGSVALLATIGLLAPKDPPRRFEFAHDVLPLLQRHGCSSAYCHGSATGRAGFKLSLFGSDPAADFAAITTQFGGRRVDLRDPERSLIVQKALGRLDHGGGRRLARDSAAVQQLREWISAGAPWRVGEPLELQALQVDVREDRLVAEAEFERSAAGGGEPLAVVRDVSDVALFATSDPTVVEVDERGKLEPRGAGQAFLSARFGNLTAVARIVRPFAATASGLGAAPSTDAAHAFDGAWSAHLAEMGLAPAAMADRSVLARRLHLDLVGRPPTPRELDAFVSAPDISAAVTRLAERREFAEVWGEHLAQWFELPDGAQTGPAAAAARRERTELIAAVAAGESLPAIARRIVLGERGARQARGEAGLVDRFGDARDRAEYAGRTLLGMRIGCARCHDHPSDRWRRSQHLAFSACFAPPRPDGAGGTMAGAMFDIDSGEQVEPHFLPLTASIAVGPSDAGERRELADFLLAEDHDAFARNACNRLFALLLGRGLVEPVDDHRVGNPPLDEPMLAALVARFHACEGRLPELLAYLMTSSAYRVASASDGPEVVHFAARSSRPLAPDTFLRAVAAVVGGTARGSLPDGALARELTLQNGAILPRLLAAGGTTIDATYELCPTPGERLRELWRTVLSRSPRPDEAERFLPYADELSGFRDLAHGLLTGREFGHLR